MKTFDLQIITPRGTFYHGKSSIITLKISEGEIGLMADRLPLMSSVKVSNFVVRDEDGKERHGVIGNGIVQTNRDEITIIVRDVIWDNDASVSAADKHIKEIEQELSQIKEEGTRKRKVQEHLDFWNLVKESIK